MAGAAAGYHTTAAALSSGKAAVLGLLGKMAPPVVDATIEEAFETPDARTPIAPFRSSARSGTYLDRGSSLITRRAAAASRYGISGLATRAVQLGLADIAAAVDIGAMAARDAGSVAGYTYSPAMKKSGIHWDDASLDAFLAAPTKKVPGTKMPISVADPAKRAALIAYLKSATAG